MQQSNAAVGRAREIVHRRVPQFLICWEPWWPSFIHNLRDALAEVGRKQTVPLSSASPGEFWPDVFVNRPIPWKNFGESGAVHILALLCVVAGTKIWLSKQHVTLTDPTSQTKLVYYSVSEYLPAISQPAPRPKAARAQKGSPAYAKQEIISVPKSPDNSTQTILNPPHPNILPPSVTVDLPNLVAAKVNPQPPVAALSNPRLIMPAIEFTPIQPPPTVRRTSSMRIALPEIAAVQPPPDAHRDSQPRMLKLPEAAPVQPPPATDALKTMTHARELERLQPQPTVEAPKLPVAEVAPAPEKTAVAATPAPPPPAAAPSTQRALPSSGGEIIALSIQPKAPEKEIKIPDASRSGIFAASPEGKVGAPGLPEIAAAKEDAHESGGSSSTAAEPSAGISIKGGNNLEARSSTGVAAAPNEPPNPSATSRPNLMAMASRPDFSRRASAVPPDDLKLQDRVFAGRRIYSMQMNMPNLTSAGGSWIIRFAELNEKPEPGDLSTPVATNKVDPAYPAQLIRDQVEGNVVLYAVIHADGTVGEVRVLEGFHQQLDENARLALLRWHFRPAMKNGVPVDLEAVVQIPFRARKIGFKY